MKNIEKFIQVKETHRPIIKEPQLSRLAKFITEQKLNISWGRLEFDRYYAKCFHKNENKKKWGLLSRRI